MRNSSILVNNEFYHIYNHSVGEEEIFNRKDLLERALKIIDFYRFKPKISYSHFYNLKTDLRKEFWKNIIQTHSPIIEIIAYCFMPNHYHFILKQVKDDGIVWFISNFQNSYSKFFNKKFQRKGSVFCHPFKRNHIDTEEQFIHLSRYIHLNPVTSYLLDIKNLDKVSETSFSVYMGNKEISFVKKDLILKYFKTKERYKEFVFNHQDYQKKLALIKKYLKV